ncbi:transcriptional regulator BetI [Rhizobium sp. CC-YZS058]|uniref:transcriptional regulator BetI n=1 Tax=Rhizobium sp. CC-YZS058 TaxID=3042153 RepID=UPI002B05DAD5|nr:transcriptional regulator BetI [Rhizobium sp. CC-YZS058]MEA3535619.1 transcriptional regulator BetI [Rhizobium sp. CC-YZS058]
MPKLGMEPVRRKALVDAALSAIGDQGTLTVTMSDIARRAGVSPALAHHYFGSKEELLIATIRSLLSDLRRDAIEALRAAPSPRARVSALIRVSFQAGQFAPETVAAWLAFYSQAQKSDSMRHLLVLYARRLHSNLVVSLAALCPPEVARSIADGAAALIDGLYLRRALAAAPLSRERSIALTEAYVDAALARAGIEMPAEGRDA